MSAIASSRLVGVRRLAVSIGAVVVACGGDFGIQGSTAVPVHARVVSSTFTIAARVDGVPGRPLIVDSGSPVTWIDPSAFGFAGLAEGAEQLDSIAMGGLTLTHVVALVTPFGDSSPSSPGGLLGGNVLRGFRVTLNYRDETVGFDAMDTPVGVAAVAATVPYRIEGGGSAQFGPDATMIRFPATRWITAATIEGQNVAVMIDTGFSAIGAAPTRFDAMIADGRGHTTIPARDSSGSTSVAATRVRSVVLAGQVVTGASMVRLTDDVLPAISAEVGESVELVIGGSFLREFFVTIDPRTGQIGFQRYDSRTHIHDELVRAGVRIAASPAGASHPWLVSELIPGTDAASLADLLGAPLTAIDGHPIDRLDGPAADLLLLGAVDEPRTLAYIDSAGTDQTVTVHCADLAPLN